MTRPSRKPPDRLGAGEKCPHCGGSGGVTEDDDGYSCVLCGNPRVLVDPPFARRGSEKPLLERAKQLRARRSAWGVAAGVATATGGFAVIVSGVLALIIHLGQTSGEVAATAVLAPLLFAAFAFSRVKQGSRAVRATLDEAELAVVGEIARARGGSIEPPALAAVLHVPLARAEELCARAQVEGFLATEEAPPPARVRVDAGAEPDAPDPVETDRRNRAG